MGVNAAPEFEAQVVATFGRHLRVREPGGAEHAARPLGRGLEIVCGDRVRCRADVRHNELHVTELLPRASALYRSNLRGVAEAVVANISRLLVVLAPRPEPDLFVVDRYLAAAGSAGIAAALVVNKSDLGVTAELAGELDAFARLGYPCVPCCTSEPAGLRALERLCASGTAALVGQSGVGKSSILRGLLPGAEVAVGKLVRNEEGRHTTTASHLFDLPGGGCLIDSPGVRDFAPAIDRLEPRSLGFIDVERLAGGCRFADCRHLREPDCAVRAATISGGLHARRYESYRRLRRLFEELQEARGPKRRR